MTRNRKHMRPLILAATLAVACGLGYARGPLPDYEVLVEVTNTTPEKKTNLPVVMTVYKIFGRNLPAGSLNPQGYHVYNEKGQEIEHMIEAIPPYDQDGNNEIVWIIPEIASGQKLTYRITNTAQRSPKRTHLDIVNSPHNLIGNGAFQKKGAGTAIAGWEGVAELDPEVKRSGRPSLRLRGRSRQEARLAAKIPLHKGSRYYFGAWGRTHEVSRHGIHTSDGAHFILTGFDSGFRGAESHTATPFAQCYTRDWTKTHFNIESYTDWGLPEMCARAAADTAEITLVLDQRPQFVRSPYQAGTWWLDDMVLMEQPELSVRFDKLLESHIKEGVFVFTRPTNMNLGCVDDPRTNDYSSMPYPREEAKQLGRFALRGQRAVFLLGVYHTRPLGTFMLRLKDGALTTRNGERLPLTEIEWLPGFLPPKRFRFLRPHTGAEKLAEEVGLPYFVLNFQVPNNAKPGRYEGQVELLVGDTVFRSVPITLRVQDMGLPVLRDISVGAILQSEPLNDEVMRQYSKTGFTGVNVGRGIFEFETGEDGKKHVKLEALGKILDWLTTYGITSRVTLWSDAELGPQWGSGRLLQAVNFDKQDFLAEVKRVEEYVQSHTEWPRLIWMTWDEPQPNGSFEFVPRSEKRQPHGAPHPMMGWPLEAVPNAWNTVDAGFWVWERVLPYYSLPNLDEPADYAGPEVYAFTKQRGKEFGFAGMAGALDERARYQVGMMLIASGAINFQYWHLTLKMMGRVDGQLLRSISMVAKGEGLDDLKIHCLLRDAMKMARQASNPERVSAANEAEEYLRKLHRIWDADHRKDQSYPYLGLAADWGYDQFYQNWQERMARYAARCKGIKWIQ